MSVPVVSLSDVDKGDIYSCLISDHLNHLEANDRPPALDISEKIRKIRCHSGDRCGTFVVRELRSREQGNMPSRIANK